MIDISSTMIYSVMIVDQMLSEIISSAIGASTGPYGTIIHLPDGTSTSDQNKAQKIFDNWGNLTPTPSLSSMVVGDADPTITQTSSDSELAYVVLLDGEVYSNGTVSVIAGTATLTLVDPEAGVYDIYFARTSGNFASGQTTITVTEV